MRVSIISTMYLSIVLGTVAAAADRASDKTDRQPLNELLTGIIVEIIPHEFEDKKHWGMQTGVFDGIKFSGQGLNIKARRREKRVNHGTWKMYRVTLVEPEKNLHVQLSEFHKAPSGRAAFDAVISGKLHAFARLSQWERGVQLASFSTDADAKVQLRVSCELGLRLDASHVPPDIVLDPQVVDADLDLVSFRVQRISQFDGPLVHELGRNLRKRVAEELDEKSDKLVAKLNKSIAKKQDKLRLSASEFLAAQWNSLREYLSAEKTQK